jgi:hypothetical protein
VKINNCDTGYYEIYTRYKKIIRHDQRNLRIPYNNT